MVILEGHNRSLGESYAPSFGGLNACAYDVAPPALSSSEGAPHEQGRLSCVEIHVFPVQGQ